MERKGCCCLGNRGQQADRVRSVTLRCQTNLVLSVRSDILPGGEMERQRSVASGKWPCSRLLPIVLAGRSLAAYCGVLPVRSIAGYCWFMSGEASRHPAGFFGCARSEAGLDCLRPSERSDSAPPLFADRGSGVERSAKLASPARARAEQCRYLPRTFRGSVGSVKPGLLFCAAIAALPISFLPRSGHLFFSCLTLAP